jgi:hypothetical protein
MKRDRGSLTLVGLLATAVGCSPSAGLQVVEGEVSDAAGRPLPGVLVVFGHAEQPLLARGTTDPNGRFRLGTKRPGQGAPVGAYRVCLAVPAAGDPDQPAARTFAARYENPATSGIEVNVVPGRNRFDFKLEAEEDR